MFSHQAICHSTVEPGVYESTTVSKVFAVTFSARLTFTSLKMFYMSGKTIELIGRIFDGKMFHWFFQCGALLCNNHNGISSPPLTITIIY